jgi:hypothetical protein
MLGDMTSGRMVMRKDCVPNGTDGLPRDHVAMTVVSPLPADIL